MLSNERFAALVGNEGLSEKVRVYVPSTTDAKDTTDAVNERSMIILAQRVLSEQFGGFTTYEATGGWVSQEYGLIKERVTIVEAGAASFSNEQLATVLHLAQQIKRTMTQEAVSVELNGVLYFV